MEKKENNVLDRLLTLVKPKGKKHYRLFMIENGVERLVEEKEIDGDKDEETRVYFEDYSKRESDGGNDGCEAGKK